MVVSDAAMRLRNGTTAGAGRLGAAAVYAVGAAIYFLAREALGMDFNASPLFYGVLLLVASYFRPRLLASAVILICWGVAVILDGRDPIADGRTAQVHALGFGIGALVCLLLRRWIPDRVALESLAVILVVVGLWYYFVYEIPELEETWLWAAVFLLSAVALVASEVLARRRTGADVAAQPSK